MNVTNFKQEFQPYLDTFLEQKYDFCKTLTNDNFILDIIRYTKKVIGDSGKRIRPYVSYLIYKASGGMFDKEAIRILVSIELFHNFALIHDDVIDEGNLRHGVPTTHVYVSEKLRENKRIADYKHIGEAHAILIGNILLSWALEIICKNNFFPENRLLEVQKCLSLMFDEVMVGQMMDVDAMTREHNDENFLYQKTLLKTATYTFVRPMQIGAILANAEATVMQFCEEFGTALGMAYQIQDDYLDLIRLDTQKRTVFLDLKERQHTHFTQYIFQNGTDSEKEQLSNFFGKELTAADSEKVRSLFETSGAFAYGKEQIENYFSKAKKSLENSSLPPKFKVHFSELISFLQTRSTQT